MPTTKQLTPFEMTALANRIISLRKQITRLCPTGIKQAEQKGPVEQKTYDAYAMAITELSAALRKYGTANKANHGSITEADSWRQTIVYLVSTHSEILNQFRDQGKMKLLAAELKTAPIADQLAVIQALKLYDDAQLAAEFDCSKTALVSWKKNRKAKPINVFRNSIADLLEIALTDGPVAPPELYVSPTPLPNSMF